MWVNTVEVSNDLIEMYARSIVICRRSPTKNCDIQRREMHNRILESVNIDRSDYVFVDALEQVVEKLINKEI